MQKDYSTYTSLKLLEDDFFIKSVYHANCDTDRFWQIQIQRAPWLEEEIRIARKTLIGTRRAALNQQLSEEDVTLLWQTIYKQTHSRKARLRHSTLFYRFAAVAAACFVGFMFFLWFNQSSTTDNPVDYMALVTKNSDATVNSHVSLILSDEEQIVFEGELAVLAYDETGRITANEENLMHVSEKEPDLLSMNQLLVPAGKRSMITFPDGTKIWINSGTQLIYPSRFSSSKREIFVNGEVYLEVTKDANRPFIVKTEALDVKVLGTSFNVKAYTGEEMTDIVLVSGKVEVNTLQQHETVTLIPDQLFAYNSETGSSKISRIDVEDYIAWKDGYYRFEGTPLHEVLQKLSDYYKIEVISDMQTDALLCSGKLDLKESLDDVLINLSKAIPVEFIRENESVIIKLKK